MKTTRRALESIAISKKESLSYLLTLILSASLLFVFINMQSDTSMDAQSIPQQNALNTVLISSCTLIVAAICAMNCYVANTYFVKAKSNELCVYTTCGMKITTLAKFLITQNMILLFLAILCALAIGCVLNPLFNILISIVTGIQGPLFTVHLKGIFMWFVILFFEMFFLILINIGYTYRTELKDLINESRTTKIPDMRVLKTSSLIHPCICILSFLALWLIPPKANYAFVCISIAFFGIKGLLTRYLPSRQEKRRRQRSILSSEKMVVQGNLNAMMKTSYMYHLMSFASILATLCIVAEKIQLQSMDIIVLIAYFLIIFMMGASIYFKIVLEGENRKKTFDQLLLLGFSKQRIKTCMYTEIIQFYRLLILLPLPYACTLGIRFILTQNMSILTFLFILGCFVGCFLCFLCLSIHNLKNTILKEQEEEETLYE